MFYVNKCSPYSPCKSEWVTMVANVDGLLLLLVQKIVIYYLYLTIKDIKRVEISRFSLVIFPELVIHFHNNIMQSSSNVLFLIHSASKILNASLFSILKVLTKFKSFVVI